MNKLRSVFLGALFGVFAFALFTPGPLSRNRPTAVSQDVVSQVRASYVTVLNPADESQGSGVIFHRNRQTYVLTAAHVVEGIPYHGELLVRHGPDEWIAIVVNADHKYDVALLRLKTRYQVGVSAELSTATLPVGTRLLHVGNLLGVAPGSYVEGHLSYIGRKSPDGEELDQTSTLAWPGSSGGGVFTTDGKLVGIITRGVGPGLNFMVPARVFQKWASENDLQWLFSK